MGSGFAIFVCEHFSTRADGDEEAVDAHGAGEY
jgi:hypothetical protein